MKYGKAAAMAVFAACVGLGVWGNCAAADRGERVQLMQKQTDCAYESAGYRLRIPKAYDNLLLTETKFKDGGRLFSVSEKASVEAAKKEYADYSGAGWIFGISRVDEAELRQMLCEDMSGRTLFARDDKGGYYIFEHPTDVRYMRESPEAMQRDQEEWSRVCSWAWSSVQENFIADNPTLMPMRADNSNIGIYLANISYRPEMKCSLSRKGKTAYSVDGIRARSFAEKLFYGNSFEMVKESRNLGDDYIKLSLPEENTDLYFFRDEGENYVLEKRAGLENNLYKAIPVEEHADALIVMQEWYEAMAEGK